MKTNFSMLFYLKKQKNYTSGPAPIYLRITVNGQRAELTANRECDPEKWNRHSGRAIGTKENIRSLNVFLDNLQTEAYEVHRYLYENDKEITAEAIKNKMLGKSETSYKLIEIFKEHNRKVESLVGQEFAPATSKRYQTSLQHTQAFLIYQFGINDIDIKKIDHAFVSEYDFYLRSIRKCNNNTTLKYIKNFGKIIRICLSNGWIVRNPFLNYKGKIKVADPVHLSEDEIQRMADKEFKIDRLNQVRDVFLFCCFTGLAYVDVKKLKVSEITKGVDGELWIFTNRQKTDTRSAIPLLPTAALLIKKYSNHPLCVNKGMPLPVPSNQKMNGYLKEIAEICGIEKTLTSHIARHTFATTVTLSNGVPIESVSKMLGHSSIKQTQHYAKILDLKVSADMILLKQKLGHRYK
ncbi:MAG: site-specific integrase [Ferruginibacter sp.]